MPSSWRQNRNIECSSTRYNSWRRDIHACCTNRPIWIEQTNYAMVNNLVFWIVPAESAFTKYLCTESQGFLMEATAKRGEWWRGSMEQWIREIIHHQRWSQTGKFMGSHQKQNNNEVRQSNKSFAILSSRRACHHKSQPRCEDVQICYKSEWTFTRLRTFSTIQNCDRYSTKLLFDTGLFHMQANFVLVDDNTPSRLPDSFEFIFWFFFSFVPL